MPLLSGCRMVVSNGERVVMIEQLSQLISATADFKTDESDKTDLTVISNAEFI